VGEGGEEDAWGSNAAIDGFAGAGLPSPWGVAALVSSLDSGAVALRGHGIVFPPFVEFSLHFLLARVKNISSKFWTNFTK
jgi:hypothetical protein